MKKLMDIFDLKFREVGHISTSELSLATIRYLPDFGVDYSEIVFGYPTIADLAAMPKDKPIQVVGFKFLKGYDNGNLQGI